MEMWQAPVRELLAKDDSLSEARTSLAFI